MELCQIAGKWGTPWYEKPTAGNGYPILQWQYDRGDYREICGFDPDDDPVGIISMGNGQSRMDDVIYNLSGQQIVKGKLPKGIYIINGRKVMR